MVKRESSLIGLMLAGPIGEMIGIYWLFVLMGTLGGIVTLFGFASHPCRKWTLMTWQI